MKANVQTIKRIGHVLRTASKPSAVCVLDHLFFHATPIYLKEHAERRMKIYKEDTHGIKK